MNFKNLVIFVLSLFLLINTNHSIGLKLDKKPSNTFNSFNFSNLKKEHIKVKKYISHSSLEKNKEFFVLFRFEMDDIWHIYGKEEKIGKVTEVVGVNDGFEILEQNSSTLCN